MGNTDSKLNFRKAVIQLTTKTQHDNPPLAQSLLNAIADLLFCPDFTVASSRKSGPDNPEDMHSIDSCEYIWEKGVGFAHSPPHNITHDQSRTELLKLLLTCFSETMYLPPIADAHNQPNQWIQYFTSTENRHALPLFTSMLNVVCAYDPVGYGVPYNHLMFTDSREPLVEMALQVLCVTLENDSDSNRNISVDGTSAGSTAMEQNTDVTRVGLMHIGVFILLLLSGERNFGVRLNKPYSVRVPMDIPVFTGTHADFLIIVFHKIITTGHQRLQPLFDCLLTIIVNVSPYLKTLSMVASTKLLHLLQAFSTPWFLYASPTNHHLVFFLLEVFNNIIQYQFDGNSNLVYTIIRKRNVFHLLANLPTEHSAIARALSKRGKKLSHPPSESKEPETMEGATPAAEAEPGTLKVSLAATPRLDKMTEKSAPDEGHHQPTLKDLARGAATMHNVQPANNIQNPTEEDEEEEEGEEVEGREQVQVAERRDVESEEDGEEDEEEEDMGIASLGITSDGSTLNKPSMFPCSLSPESLTSAGGDGVGVGRGGHSSSSPPPPPPHLLRTGSSMGSAAPWVATPDWVASWKQKLPLQTIMRMLQVLVPQVEKICIDKGLKDESEILKFLQHGTLVGLLPVPHPILIRKYQANSGTTMWFRTYLWGVIYLRNVDPPIWYDTDVKLFEIQRV
ncbi:protein HID1 [Octopus bimaculoides]|uniref:protein HID1 n=1 Tax=Octopus bimaculoides TaxID=37653 RepID=UPI00071DD0A8|nr:protein HID1 [Octopus bimaculoides]|eukprot:XP_014788685.1 PREDICTED: protein HID1-like [Octopus bimaculoides]